MPCVTPLRLAVALAGAGWHPEAGRAPDAEPRALLSADYWTGLAQEAERGKLDFVTFEDSLTPGAEPTGDATEDATEDGASRLVGRLDAALIAARVAPLTSRIGLVPTVSTTHPEPFHTSTAIATLDRVSSGRAGWHPRIGRPGEARPVGRRDEFEPADLLAEASEAVEVALRLWDSPPQGQPVVMTLAHSRRPYRFAARSADVVLVTPSDEDDVRRIVGEVRAAEAETGRPGAALRIFADLMVFLDSTDSAAADRKARLDARAGAEISSDAAIFVGSPAQLMRRLQAWQRAGIEGFRLRPGALPHDLHAITRGLVPTLQENDAFRRGYEAKTLRSLLGVPRPANRYPTPAAPA